MIVVDASAVALAVSEGTAAGSRTRQRLRHEQLSAPELLDLEVLAALRRLVQRELISAARAAAAVRDLRALPVHRVRHGPLLARCWELRDTVTPYDAAYVATAEELGVPLLTADARLSRASGPRCAIELVA